MEDQEFMTYEEAMYELGYSMNSSLMWDLKTGRIRADGQGRIRADSVRKRRKYLDRTIERRAAFLGKTVEELETERENNRQRFKQ